MSAGGVIVSTTSSHEGRAGSIPSPALQSILLRPIPPVAARNILEKNHYLHSFAGCTKLCFGVFVGNRLFGAITFGAGPANAFRLAKGATPDDCMALTRLWLSEELPTNSESRVIAVSLRYLRKYTRLKFIVTYADPAHGHVGTIYQATNWLYTGLSEATPRFDLGDGIARHSRSFNQAFGSHSLTYLKQYGMKVKIIPQIPKYRYVYFLDKDFKRNLNTPILSYPRKESDIRVGFGVWGGPPTTT